MLHKNNIAPISFFSLQDTDPWEICGKTIDVLIEQHLKKFARLYISAVHRMQICFVIYYLPKAMESNWHNKRDDCTARIPRQPQKVCKTIERASADIQKH